MKILMVTSEATPFAKAGGLGDAVSALSRALARAGHDVRLILPRYYFIDRSGLEQVGGPLSVHHRGQEVFTAVYRSVLPSSEVPVYFLDYEAYFGRDGIYGTKAEPDFKDNPQRFALLCRAVFPLCRRLSWFPDILHAHDWPSALAPIYLRYLENYGEFAATASVLSIHNLGYQGIYPKESFSSLGLPWDLYFGAGLEHFDQVNLLKGGLSTADCLTTVSPTYSREIQTPELGAGLDGLLRSRSSELVGILNGVDSDDWNPSRDPIFRRASTPPIFRARPSVRPSFRGASAYASIRGYPSSAWSPASPIKRAWPSSLAHPMVRPSPCAAIWTSSLSSSAPARNGARPPSSDLRGDGCPNFRTHQIGYDEAYRPPRRGGFGFLS